jgi:hypothetical protein
MRVHFASFIFSSGRSPPLVRNGGAAEILQFEHADLLIPSRTWNALVASK